ncbi:MAG: nickel pincer cofactor biosynthesis protein LarC [Caulobacteraceae bacterium]
MKTLYFDCFSGISGDMTLGALLNVGADENVLREGLRQLNIEGYSIGIENKLKNGITGTDFSVLLEGQPEDEHEHKHGEHYHHHDHLHEHGHGHEHEHSHEHVHRTMKDIETIINESTLNENVKRISLDIFRIIAEAEGKIHGKPVNEVHFHEVGAVDSIVDIIGTAICVDNLKVDRIVFSSLPLSRGFVKCQHGVFPLPAPAALEILKDAPVYYTDYNFELVTPTGAAIAKGLADEFGMVGENEIERIGYGLGKKTYEIPNVLRVILFNSKKKSTDTVVEIDTNIDDMAPEQLGYVMERLFEQGALDVFFTSIFMKKNRPGIKLTVLCHPDKKASMTDIIFRDTSTFGIRCVQRERTILDREFIKVETGYGEIRCKIGRQEGKIIKYSPEYEDCKAASLLYGKPIADIYNEAIVKMADKLKELEA